MQLAEDRIILKQEIFMEQVLHQESKDDTEILQKRIAKPGEITLEKP